MGLIASVVWVLVFLPRADSRLVGSPGGSIVSPHGREYTKCGFCPTEERTCRQARQRFVISLVLLKVRLLPD